MTLVLIRVIECPIVLAGGFRFTLDVGQGLLVLLEELASCIVKVLGERLLDLCG